jgi:metallo-beta-lactamase family protein
MKITFFGAAGEVTGSQHCIENNGHRMLLDCGLFQGRREEAYDKNRHPDFDPATIEAIVLSHAHLDHSGRLPRLTSLGYRGPIYATPITAELCDPLLKDSAHIQLKDLEFANKIRKRKGLLPYNLLYSNEDAEQALEQFVTIDLNTEFQPMPGVSVKYIEAGHLLGSAQMRIELTNSGNLTRLGFTGDLGRAKLPILQDPEQLSDLDVLICESTYGNREHEAPTDVLPELSGVLDSTFAKGGKVIIPAFALERTQELLYHLARLRAGGRLAANIPIFVDSPLAIKATEIFSRHPEAYDSETRRILESGTGPFEFAGVHFLISAADSIALNEQSGPMIIIAASGMCEAGRILHHLKNNIEDSRNTILIVSFQAEHTLGRRIAERKKEVNIFGEPYPLRARVKIMNHFSGHAGRSELIAYLQKVINNSPRLRKIFFVHGEPDSASALIETIQPLTKAQCIYPKRGVGFEL